MPNITMDPLDSITVTVSRHEEICADKADIYISVAGSAFITGSTALTKSKEVAQLMSELYSGGLIKASDVTLRGAQADSRNGFLGRGTLTTYLLKIHCPTLDSVADVLAIVTSQRSVTLDHLAWRFPDYKILEEKWLGSCLDNAKEKAAKIASSLGVKLLAVHSLSEKWLEHETKQHVSPIARGDIPKTAPDELAFSLVMTKQLELRLEINYRISNYA